MCPQIELEEEDDEEEEVDLNENMMVNEKGRREEEEDETAQVGIMRLFRFHENIGLVRNYASLFIRISFLLFHSF